ncbi:MAG: serine/threonine protein kinase [Solirubrobacteraceae bacterium]|nr:serine/threonine protein kinase [Solirubrobacteraceae bacterium]
MSTEHDAILQDQRFGPYLVEGVLGRGGMGVVYQGRHVHLDRPAAIKVLGDWWRGDEEARERFLRESRLAARLQHPNIVAIYDAGELDGRLYVAMQLVRGGDLHTLLDNGALAPARALSIIEQLASALDTAHDAGLVHRDVKPGNVLLEGDRAVLSDFGLIKPLHAQGPEITRVGEFMGTVEWAAPEQIEPERFGPLSAQTDVYALGALLYACLTGELPYDADSVSRMLFAHLHEPPPRLDRCRDDVSEELQAVIDRAMAKVPGERFMSCGDLAAAAREALEADGQVMPVPVGLPPRPSDHGDRRPSQPSSPRSPSGFGRETIPTRSRSRRPLMLGAALALVAVLAIAAVVALDGDDGRAAYAATWDVSRDDFDSEMDTAIERAQTSGSLALQRDFAIDVRDAARQHAQRLRAVTPPDDLANEQAALIDALILLADEASNALAASRYGSIEPVRRFSERLQQGQDPADRAIDRATAQIDQALS